MTNELKCPCCGGAMFNNVKWYTCTRDSHECGFGCPVDMYDKIAFLTPEQQKWQELAPEFDTDKYEYLWQENTVNWVEETGIPEEYELYQKGLLRRIKAPKITVEEKSGCYWATKAGHHPTQVPKDIYEAITASLSTKCTCTQYGGHLDSCPAKEDER
jgi:hypothetical protein